MFSGKEIALEWQKINLLLNPVLHLPGIVEDKISDFLETDHQQLVKLHHLCLENIHRICIRKPLAQQGKVCTCRAPHIPRVTHQQLQCFTGASQSLWGSHRAWAAPQPRVEPSQASGGVTQVHIWSSTVANVRAHKTALCSQCCC